MHSDLPNLGDYWEVMGGFGMLTPELGLLDSAAMFGRQSSSIEYFVQVRDSYVQLSRRKRW